MRDGSKTFPEVFRIVFPTTLSVDYIAKRLSVFFQLAPRAKDIDLFYANISIDDLIANKPLPNKEPILSRSLHFTNWLRENVARN